MTTTDIQIAICGSAGDGTIAAGGILNQAMARAGYKVIAFDVYPAEIRGFGECIARSRITADQVYSLKTQSDILVSLNDGHAIAHVPEVRRYGAVIYDDAPMAALKEGQHISGHIQASQLPYGLPMREISERATSAAKSRNMVALGFLAGLYAMPRDAFHETIKAKFKGKAGAITEGNLKAFDAGYEEGQGTFKYDFTALGAAGLPEPGAVMMSGNQAIVRGCLDAGVETFFGYPITPATTILEMLAVQMPKRGGRVLQTEDEISAIGAAIGAGYAGARAATATSGPGLALMTEMMGLGVMTEVPVVVFVSQRGGPSTGMPTKTEQSDLNLAVYGGSGDARAHRDRADQRRGLLSLRGARVRARRAVPDAGDRAARPLPLQPARELRRARQDQVPARCREGAVGAPARALPALRDDRGPDQPARGAGRARRHPYRDRARAQRGRAAQGHARDPYRDDREAA